MKSSRILLLTAALCTLLSSCGPELPVRTMHYFPDGLDIVCLNGNGRYTRALYGTGTRFRLETSDRPVFAVYDEEDSYNFCFSLNGLPLDSTAHCIARYRGGLRSYELGDPSWDGGRLKVTALASFHEEGALWKFEASGFSATPVLKAVKRRIADTDMFRAGDLGTDAREKFEAAPDDPGVSIEWAAENESYLFYHHPTSWDHGSAEAFDREMQAQETLASRIVFDTPDPFLNTVGANLSAAVEGIWDDETHTWLHGAIGWRMPYAGWRGAFAGDATGWSDRSREHFRAYLKSMVTDVPQIYSHPQQDTLENLCRAEHKWGTPMYSNGYICRHPGRSDEISHYDMNLNFIDELLTHVSYDADPAFLREIWPYLLLHLDWEKRNFDPDGDHLYDGYCCIWASDALYYNSGAVTHSSAYNYRGNLLTARIAEIIGEDPTPYREEAEAILEAMDDRLWIEEEGHWAEYQDFMGLKRLHKDAAVWSIYTPVDCGACSPEQAWRATGYVESRIPHIPVLYSYDLPALEGLGLKLPPPCRDLYTISTSDWMPYVWSTNNVAHSEVANTALAFLQAGRGEEGFRLLKSDLIDEMYLGQCPGNFGLISWYDKARQEAYRDFADNVGITSRALLNGLFGILPDALNGICVLKPALPSDWDHASVRTPYLSYSYHREAGKDIYEIEQHFARPLKIILRAGTGGSFMDVEGSDAEVQTIVVDRRSIPSERRSGKKARSPKPDITALGLSDIKADSPKRMVDISAHFNSNVDDIFRNEYLSPRSPYTTLSLPKQGFGEWCIPQETHEIEDDGLRAVCREGVFDTGLGLTFLCPAEGPNTVFTSLWDNYPGSVSIPLGGRASAAYLLMAGSTNSMQSHIENGRVTVRYTDGSTSTLSLENPYNWCPVEQDYFVDGLAFRAAGKRPYRVLLEDGRVMREPVTDSDNASERFIPSGAAQILRMPLRRGRELESLTLETLSNDVVVGLMGVTLEEP